MLSEKVCGIILVFLGLGETFFAKKIFDFFIQLPGTKIWQIERWPPWMFPTWIWLMRITGILLVVVGLLLIFTKRQL
jgi:uncharacterized membrane protein